VDHLPGSYYFCYAPCLGDASAGVVRRIPVENFVYLAEAALAYKVIEERGDEFAAFLFGRAVWAVDL